MVQLLSGLPENVSDDEDLARFLTVSGHFNTIGIRHIAFMPNPKDGETSVFRHAAKPAKELWRIGDANIVNGTLHGAAIIKAKDVRVNELTVLSDEPPLRHAAIQNWPMDNDPDLRKAHQKELALRLANAAVKILRT